MPESMIFPKHMALDPQTDSSLSVENNQRRDLTLSDSPSPRNSRDSSWLQVAVCRDFKWDTCPRGDHCRFAHPDAKVMGRDAKVMGRDAKVTCCYDFLKSRCSRDFCKYYHPPAHIKDRLVNAGRQFGAMMFNVSRYPQAMAPQLAGQCLDVEPAGPVVFAYGPMGDNRLPICQDFLIGQCYLALCPFVHPGPNLHHNMDQTVTVCRNYIRGMCVRGEKCRFYHPPPYHLQPPPILSLPNQGMPMVQLPMYYPSTPLTPPPVIPMGIGVQSPFPGVSPPLLSPFMPPVPVVPMMSMVLVPSPFVPQAMMVAAPTTVTDTNSDEGDGNKD